MNKNFKVGIFYFKLFNKLFFYFYLKFEYNLNKKKSRDRLKARPKIKMKPIAWFIKKWA